jgi:hypothetical protein
MTNNLPAEFETGRCSATDLDLGLRCIDRPTGLPWFVRGALGAMLNWSILWMAVWISPEPPMPFEQLALIFMAVCLATLGFVGGAILPRFGWLHVHASMLVAFTFGMVLACEQVAVEVGFPVAHGRVINTCNAVLFKFGVPPLQIPEFDPAAPALHNLRVFLIICLTPVILVLVPSWLIALFSCSIVGILQESARQDSGEGGPD